MSLHDQPTYKIPRYTLQPLTNETQRACYHFNQLRTRSAQFLRQGYLTAGCLYIASVALEGAQLLLSSENDTTLAIWNEQATKILARLDQISPLKGVSNDVCGNRS